MRVVLWGEQSRQDILKIHSRKMNLMRGINLKKIGDKMNGSSGAEMKVREHVREHVRWIGQTGPAMVTRDSH